jgi:tetratricopeptide (TPR) repeat protein
MMKAALAWTLLGAALIPFGGKAHHQTEKGNRAYESEEYEEALRAYTEAQVEMPEAPELHYDIGNVLYRQEDYERATEAYTRALLSASTPLVPNAAYNLGNALYREGRYQEAVDAFRRSLEARPDDDDAKHNLELARRALQQQQQQQQDQEGQDQQQQQQQQQEQEQPQESPDPSQQGESPQPSPDQQESSGDEKPPEQQPGRMTADQAERLLDSLAEEEAETLRRRARERAAREDPALEEDW